MANKSDDSWCCNLTGEMVGDYKLLDFVGKGKIGYVYRAQKRNLPELDWAVKLIFKQPKLGWENELQKVMKLQQVQGVVHFHYLGTDMVPYNGSSTTCHYTVWDYIHPGENLKNYLNRKEEVRISFLVAVVECILHVLHACHEKGVNRHGDLHSGNILIGNASNATLDYSLEKREPIFVSDFGYGTTGAAKTPKDDYEGLAQIINEIISKVNYSKATTATDRQILKAMQRDIGKLLNEPALTERAQPLDLLHILTSIKKNGQALELRAVESAASEPDTGAMSTNEARSVGQFQVSEMIGDRWDWWKRLFVSTVPARSRILALDIPTVVTGPRGCGKTMLFRRLSERLIIECGEFSEFSAQSQFVAFYVNANDFADAFSHFPEKPTKDDEEHLTCYANLCVLADLLAIQSARAGRLGERASDELLSLVKNWLVPDEYFTVLEGEDRLERCRTILEQIKWKFFKDSGKNLFPGYNELSQHRWLPQFIQQINSCCPWILKREVFLFIDDFSIPRISPSMQRVLNRLFFQRSPHFLTKIATEASSTFIPEDSSGKNLQDGDDFQLIDMGEESLFLTDSERLSFLNEVFSRRLKLDPRIPENKYSLLDLLGRMPLSKTEFARRLRGSSKTQPQNERPNIGKDSQRRGRSRARVEYFGENVFSDLWSGDTRTMIQLITEVVDNASGETLPTTGNNKISLPVKPDIQDRVFRSRGGEWLNSHARNEPTDRKKVDEEIAKHRISNPGYKLAGEYGDHLKAVVEAFFDSARKLLFGPTYTIRNGKATREVPRMAFRIEIIDEFRIDGLAKEIYRDLIRYGLFMRDNRGKSVRGTFVPRLYLRRLLLPLCTLALSKRDSVMLTCEEFLELLLEPDAFKRKFSAAKTQKLMPSNQMSLYSEASAEPDPAYDDIGFEDFEPPNSDEDIYPNNDTAEDDDNLEL